MKINEIVALEFDQLRVVCGGSRAEQSKAFGTHFSSKADAKELEEKAKQYIKAGEVWMANWKTLLEGLAPELAEVHEQEVTDVAEKAENLNKQQKEALIARLQAQVA